MKRLILLFGVLLLSVGIAAACSSNTDNNEVENNVDANVEEGNNETNENVEDENEATDANDEEMTTDVETEIENELDTSSSSEFDDQTDLKIGDTGQMDSTLGKFEITIKSIKQVDSLDGEVSMFDHIFIADVTVKNIGDTPIDARDIITSLEITDDLEGSGSEDTSEHFMSVNALNGTIAPGESLDGEAVYEARDSDTYYIRVVSGLIASGAVKNEATWTFNNNEVEKE